VQLSEDAAARVLSLEAISISESLLFNAAIAWYRAHSKKRRRDQDDTVLENPLQCRVVQCIRFGLFTVRQIFETVRATGLFGETDILDMIQCSDNHPGATRFSKTQRKKA